MPGGSLSFLVPPPGASAQRGLQRTSLCLSGCVFRFKLAPSSGVCLRLAISDVSSGGLGSLEGLGLTGVVPGQAW